MLWQQPVLFIFISTFLHRLPLVAGGAVITAMWASMLAPWQQDFLSAIGALYAVLLIYGLARLEDVQILWRFDFPAYLGGNCRRNSR